MSSSDTPKCVVVKGNPPQWEANAANGNIKPGMLVELTSAGTVRPATSTGFGVQTDRAPAFFAIEQGYVGGTIDDAYATSDIVNIATCAPGTWLYAFLSAGEDVGIGALLQSDGAGALELVDSDGFHVAIAREAVDNNPGSGDAPVRILVEVV
jgi:hypothetical protein